MIVKPIKTKIFKENEDILDFIFKHIKKIKEGSVLAVTSKIVALSEGRTEVIHDIRTKEMLIKREADFAMPTKYVWLTIRDGVVMPSSGVDESNADGKIILLPKDSFRSAERIRKAMLKHYKVKRLGVVITDSRTMPLRAGVTGVALGYAGFRGLKLYTGKKDIFGRKFKFSRVDTADCLATSAVYLMGEGGEQQPLALIENTPVEFCERVNKKELHIDVKDDMYGPIFPKFFKV